MLRYRKFLLQLPESVDLADIYGTDTDAVSIRIARLNMALKYPDADVEEICEHITEKNFLTEYDRMGFDTIIGNPPWGYAFSNEDKAVLKARYATASEEIPSPMMFLSNGLWRFLFRMERWRLCCRKRS